MTLAQRAQRAQRVRRVRRALPAGLREDLVAALPGWVVARLLVAVSWAVAVVSSEELRGGARTVQLAQGLFAWDGAFYRDIAERGYGDAAGEALRFFPLFPLLGRGLGTLLGGNEALALVLVANGAALVAATLVHRLTRFETDDRVVAARAAWLTSLFPAAFVMVWGYAEPLLVALGAATFLGLRRGRWWSAAALGLAAGLVRPIGAVLALPALIEAMRSRGSSPLLPRVAAVAGPLGGLGAFLVWAEVAMGDGLAPLRLQTEFRGDVVDPLSRLARGVGDLVGDERLGDGLHVPFAVAFIVLAVVVARRLPASYGAFTVAVVVVAVSADNLNSLERYGLNAFPLVMALAMVGRRPWLDRSMLVCSGAGLVALGTLAWVGAYVP